VFEDDYRRGGREEEGTGGIMSTERGMKRLSQIFLRFRGETGFSGRCEKDELYRKKTKRRIFDSFYESYVEKGLSSNALRKS